jgi:hypothetical protein
MTILQQIVTNGASQINTFLVVLRDDVRPQSHHDMLHLGHVAPSVRHITKLKSRNMFIERLNFLT